MKQRSLLLSAAILVAFAVPATATAQDENTWFTVFADHVAIHNQQAFEEHSRKFIAMMNEAGIEGVSWVTISGSDVGYAYSIPGMGPGDFDDMNAGWGEVMASLGQPAMDLMAESNKLVDSRDMFYLMLRSDLSYMPDAVDMVADKPYRDYTYLYVVPGMEAEFETSVGAWRDAYADASIERGWRIYSIVSGTDLPAYLVVSSAEDEHKHQMMAADVREALGDRYPELRAMTGKTLRRVEERSGWVRPELSYPAMGMEGDTD